MAGAWQPIDTAPKETPVLVVDETHSRPARVVCGELTKHGEWLSVPGRYQMNVTGWMPLPEVGRRAERGK